MSFDDAVRADLYRAAEYRCPECGTVDTGAGHDCEELADPAMERYLEQRREEATA